jgi:formate dehydrogenase major subunit
MDAEFGFSVPRTHGYDALQTVEGLQRGDVKVFIAMGGNFVGAISDTAAAEAAMRGASLTVQVSTKLNRSHVPEGCGPETAATGRFVYNVRESA